MSEETMRYMRKIAELSGCKLVKVPEKRRVTAKGTLELQKEILSNMEENKLMRFESTEKASKV